MFRAQVRTSWPAPTRPSRSRARRANARRGRRAAPQRHRFGAALRRRVRHRVHHRAGQALDAADRVGKRTPSGAAHPVEMAEDPDSRCPAPTRSSGWPTCSPTRPGRRRAPAESVALARGLGASPAGQRGSPRPRRRPSPPPRPPQVILVRHATSPTTCTACQGGRDPDHHGRPQQPCRGGPGWGIPRGGSRCVPFRRRVRIGSIASPGESSRSMGHPVFAGCVGGVAPIVPEA